MLKIKASEKNLDDVFGNEYLFQIPNYQRPYAWTTEEVGELLDDLLFAVDKDAEAQKEDAEAPYKNKVQDNLRRFTVIISYCKYYEKQVHHPFKNFRGQIQGNCALILHRYRGL